ncbi:hypothetical protein Ga0076813_14461 [endosymbiont of Ridgeia piscesae]|uniref:Uncharacterized protein n=1 Tax=endosymbiont of Ridgeia piscesae TaxID=54398 RepID=A0A0T5Z7K8_9GAMM|nr:hypothetical protein Ga0076813_14461 [endosymbiont of Ridgeia piscesae]
MQAQFRVIVELRGGKYCKPLAEQFDLPGTECGAPVTLGNTDAVALELSPQLTGYPVSAGLDGVEAFNQRLGLVVVGDDDRALAVADEAEAFGDGGEVEVQIGWLVTEVPVNRVANPLLVPVTLLLPVVEPEVVCDGVET